MEERRDDPVRQVKYCSLVNYLYQIRGWSFCAHLEFLDLLVLPWLHRGIQTARSRYLGAKLKMCHFLFFRRCLRDRRTRWWCYRVQITGWKGHTMYSHEIQTTDTCFRTLIWVDAPLRRMKIFTTTEETLQGRYVTFLAGSSHERLLQAFSKKTWKREKSSCPEKISEKWWKNLWRFHKLIWRRSWGFWLAAFTRSKSFFFLESTVTKS